MSSTQTHLAVATPGPREPLILIQRPTVSPSSDEIRVRVEWVVSTPLDLHQADGGLLVKHPQVLGDSLAGTVVEVGDQVQSLKVGDKVFGFVWSSDQERAQQTYVTAPHWKFGKIPEGFSMKEVVTLPNNFVTAWHTFTTDLGVELPWPKPEGYSPSDADKPILIWGGSSSVGQYAIQILKYYGYRNIIATASQRHHEELRGLGAKVVFDYRNEGVVDQILATGNEQQENSIPRILDCIGSVEGSIRPISGIAKSGTTVAILLPVIVRHASDAEAPIYGMDVGAAAEWKDGVKVRGVRTHFYADNEFHKYHLQPEIMPALLKEGIVKPNAQKLVDGKDMLERAQRAILALRRREVSGERLVWKVADAHE
ncbi:GroES-like protein [Westerdykella ornata]|uniref:GroES-like protein n=1 Tax=Westerdykella ornata TaxID=318751 RepID=A0A6A6JS39_WESOR|nr:GroES-like protein [Westerdykella ornata]KAF2279441.1 GroES-like protein [Westerdykella ornata]